MTTVLQNKAQVQDSPFGADQQAKAAVELTAQQVAALYNLLKAEEDYGEGLPLALVALRRELKEKARALGLSFREGYAYLR